MNDYQKTLLEKHIFVLPEAIEHEVYMDLMEVLLFHPAPIDLYCHGRGGDSASALAMVDLIRQHGNVTGILIGEAASSHGYIWAACQKRYVHPNGRLGIHMISWYAGDGARYDSNALLARGVDLATTEDQYIAQIYADASSRPREWWIGHLHNIGSTALHLFRASELIEMEMAIPISQRIASKTQLWDEIKQDAIAQ